MVKDDINICLDSEIGDMLESPLAVLEKAYELAPDDTTVLNIYGRSLWNNCERMKSNGFTHDLFVFRSHEDDDWVDDILVPQLESTFLEDDIIMKGNPYSRLATNKR